ncbi:MAG: DUF5329 family protein [Leptospiraceae bacterium]|nr:DUF5329 family protein [Leptospiraceae bacterium]
MAQGNRSASGLWLAIGLISLALSGSLTHPAHAQPGLSEERKIELLIRSVENSNNTFIRGGSEYSAQEAGSHMRMKWSRAGKKRVNTARLFIKYIASESSLLGTPYYMKKPDGTKIKSRDYLLQRLHEIESQGKS